jgi:hypothetical protein
MTEPTSEVDKNLSTILNVEYETVEANTPSTEVVTTVEEHLPAPLAGGTDRDVAYDYEFARITHRELIDKGTELLSNASRVAIESQHPRAYEVAGQLLTAVSNMTDKLMKLQKDKKDLEASVRKGGKESAQVNVEQAVFVGSTSELLKQVRGTSNE